MNIQAKKIQMDVLWIRLLDITDILLLGVNQESLDVLKRLHLGSPSQGNGSRMK